MVESLTLAKLVFFRGFPWFPLSFVECPGFPLFLNFYNIGVALVFRWLSLGWFSALGLNELAQKGRPLLVDSLFLLCDVNYIQQFPTDFLGFNLPSWRLARIRWNDSMGEVRPVVREHLEGEDDGHPGGRRQGGGRGLRRATSGRPDVRMGRKMKRGIFHPQPI